MNKIALLLALALFAAGCGDREDPPADDGAASPEVAPAEDRPLEAALREKREGFRASAPDELKATFEQAAREIEASGVLERAKRVGSDAPDFELEDPNGRPHALADLRAEGPIVLAFYRGKW